MLLFTSCNIEQNDFQVPKELIVGVLPDQEEEALLQIYTPLLTYLEAESGINYKLIIPSDYNELVTLFVNKQVDLAYFGGVTFMQAHELSGAKPIVIRDVDKHFTSYLITRADKEVTSLADLEGKSLAFGSKVSTSGHIMPRYFLHEMGIQPDKYFNEIIYSGSHDKTLELVIQGRVDGGMINSSIFDLISSSHPEISKSIHVTWQSPSYPDYVWAMQSDTPPELQNLILNSFLSLTTLDKQHRYILNRMDTKAFYPVNINEFSELNEALNIELGLGND